MAEEEKAALEEALKTQREIQQELLSQNATDEQKEIAEAMRRYSERLDILRKANQDTLFAYIAFKEEEKAIRQKYKQEQEADEDANFDKLAEQTAAYENKKTEIIIDNNEKRRKLS